ncbi:MAG: hypothetical protein ACJARS_000433 [bacterium]
MLETLRPGSVARNTRELGQVVYGKGFGPPKNAADIGDSDINAVFSARIIRDGLDDHTDLMDQ